VIRDPNEGVTVGGKTVKNGQNFFVIFNRELFPKIVHFENWYILFVFSTA
jgi:hypothetical protein